ncbi:MAG: hypothetical protein ACTSXO_06790 [Candidatus Heimdallarchaeota archaeon]
MARKQRDSSKRIPELTISPQLKQEVDALVQATYKTNVRHWSPAITREFYVPIGEVGEIRVLHVKPKQPKNTAPVLFIPGFGVIQEEFNDLYEALQEDIEFYYIETREKTSSKIKRRKTKLTLSEKAKDIQTVIDFLNLSQKDFLLVGTCWGSSVVLTGLYEKTLTAPRILLFDPAFELAFSKFIVNISILLPTFMVSLLKRIFKFFALMGMKEKRQKERTSAFIDNAVVWKWKRAAYQNRKLNLFKILPAIEKELFIVNGSNDRFHNQEIYPMEAKALPHGRFFYLEVDESKRERMMAAVIREFALGTQVQPVPLVMQKFEKNLKREENLAF